MKKLLLSLAILLCSVSVHADYSATNKTIKVVIPQGNIGGLAQVFLLMQNYASKKQISLVPVFKPGAQGKIGLDYTADQLNDGSTLLLTTVSELVENNSVTRFEPVSAVLEAKAVLVSSKNSKIKTIEDITNASPDKFNWVYASPMQSNLIKVLADHNKLEKEKMQLISFNPAKGVSVLASIVAGDADLAFLPRGMINKFLEKDMLTEVKLDSSTKLKLDSKVNAISVMLPKKSSDEIVLYWTNFISEFVKDDSVTNMLVANNSSAQVIEPGRQNLKKIISAWAN